MFRLALSAAKKMAAKAKNGTAKRASRVSASSSLVSNA